MTDLAASEASEHVDLYRNGRETGVRDLLAHARGQAHERGYGGFPIVDVDAHHHEDRSWSEIIPYMDNASVRQWAESMVDRDHAAQAGGTTIPGAQIGNQDVGGRILRQARTASGSVGDVVDRDSPVHADVQRMLWAMDMIGIDYSIMFPTPMLLLGLHPQVEVEVELSRAYTRWLTRELLPQSDRIKTFAYLPFNDPEASLRAVREFADDPGVVGFMVTSVRYRPVHHNDYAPVYAELAERGMPIAFHAAYNWQEQSMVQLNKFISVHALGFTFCNMTHLTNIVVNGIPERFPGLKLLWVESGVAWIPFMMQRLDNEFLMRTSEAPLLQRLPSDYMREMYFSTQPIESVEHPDVLQTTFEMIDAERSLVYSSDYPHWDFNLPATIYDLPFLSEQAKRGILGGNALRLLGLESEAAAGGGAAGARFAGAAER